MTTNTTGRFADLGISEKLLASLTEKGFTTPTPIQHQVIASGIAGKDVVGIAQTGTGKTLAFGIPMIQRIAETKSQGLILVPTRELALQVEEALQNVAGKLGLRTVVVIGGTSQKPQVSKLRNNPNVVIATPGRLVDLMEQGLYKLDKVGHVTLDEADRMLDVGFLPQIKRILKTIRKERQTMLFSATMPKTITSLAREFMQTPLRVEIAPQGTSAERVEQEIFFVSKAQKMQLLDAVLHEHDKDVVIIFSRTKHGAKRITRDLNHMGIKATEIHGNRSQNQRVKSLEGFTKGAYRVLVATDIAARGIDVDTVSLVINFDLPSTTDDYVHRIGRTGRAGRSGKAISFAMQDERGDVKKIERLIRKQLPVKKLPTLPAKRTKAPLPPRQPGHRPPRGHGGGGRGNGNRNRSGGGSRRPGGRGGNKPQFRRTGDRHK